MVSKVEMQMFPRPKQLPGSPIVERKESEVVVAVDLELSKPLELPPVSEVPDESESLVFPTCSVDH